MPLSFGRNSKSRSNPTSSTADDEALARQLQDDELRLAEQRRRSSSDAPPAGNPAAEDDAIVARRLEQVLRDQAMAARLQQQEQSRTVRTTTVTTIPAVNPEFQASVDTTDTSAVESPNTPDWDETADADLARRLSQNDSPTRLASPSKFFRAEESDLTNMTLSTSNTSDGSNPSADIFLDEELARQMQQEMRDEELARQLQREQQAVQGSYVVQEAPVPASRYSRVAASVCPVAVVAGIVVLLIFFLGGGKGLGALPDDYPFIGDERDPFVGVNPDEVNRWNNQGSGLRLEVLNALSDAWLGPFAQAINDWDYGTPDAVDLTTQRIPHETECSGVQDKLKVCNGDYGATRWRGINQVLLSNGYIIASSAKMNEHYLDSADTAQRQYTMCHEIGHGLGLPHTDEDFFNADLGNCMDYTSNPEANKSPDESNYIFLMELYGEIMNGRRLRSRSGDEASALPEWVLEAWKETAKRMESSDELEELPQGTRLLHNNEFGEAHEADLGEGYVLRVHKLF